jgi:hypothetical protein
MIVHLTSPLLSPIRPCQEGAGSSFRARGWPLPRTLEGAPWRVWRIIGHPNVDAKADIAQMVCDVAELTLFGEAARDRQRLQRHDSRW